MLPAPTAPAEVTVPRQAPRRSARYELSRPLIGCSKDALPGKRADRIRARVTAVIDAVRRPRQVQAVSVVWSDLESDEGFVIGPTTRYRPASLMKLPFAMAWMKKGEFVPGALATKLTPGKVEQAVEDMGDGTVVVRNPQLNDQPRRLRAGQPYSVTELIGRSLVESDNDAAWLLSDNLDKAHADHIYELLELRNPLPDGADRVVEITTIAAFFHALYDATYLSAEASDHVLQLLSRSPMRKGIVSGLAPNIRCAHKFGIDQHEVERPDEVHFHDCGIVYSQRPYLLCVMTQGKTSDALIATVADISRAVTAEIGPGPPP